MSKPHYIRYPKEERVFFDGGLNSKFPAALLPDNESPSCQNVIFSDGAVETRGGTSKLNTAAAGSFICDGLYTRHDNSGAETMVAWFGGSLWYLSGTSFITVGSAQSIYSVGERVYGAEYENYLFFGNGSGTPYKYGGDGSTFTRHGIPAPTTTITVATAPTGIGLTGDYRYKVTYVNSGLVESDVNPGTSTLTVANQNIRLTSIPVAPTSFGVNQRYLYRTAAGGSTYKRLATLNNNTTTTYDDAIADASLGVDAPADQGEPPNYSAIIYHGARLFVIDPDTNLVMYSEIGNPYVFKALSFLRVGDNTGDRPTALAIYDNSLIVFCRENPWMIYMPSTDDTDWAALRIRANFGSRSGKGHFKYENQVMYPAVQSDKFVGFAAVAGQTVTPSASLLTNSAVGSELQSQRIEPDIFDMQESELDNVVSYVYQNKAYIAMSKGTSQTTNNRIYVFDFSLGELSTRQTNSWVPWTGLNANDFTVYGGNLYYGTSTATGFVYRMNTSTYADNGTAIDSYFWTKEFSGRPGEENLQKDFRFTNIFYERSGSYDMDLTIKVDSSSGSGFTDQINLDPGGSNWGTMIWGVNNWDPGEGDGETKYSLGTFRGKRIQFKFSNQNTVNQKFKVYGLNFLYNNKGLR